MVELINWNSFNAQFNNREQWAFENMAYFLFCSENDCPIGLFRYKNQPGIETEPIEKDGGKTGFQAKYYSSSIKDNKQDIIDSIDKSKSYYPSITTLLFYLNKEFSKSTKTKGDPKYKTEIEQYAKSKNIKIDWRVPSQIEIQLVQPQNKWIKDIFFGGLELDPVFFNRQVEKSVANLGERYNAKLNFELPIAKLFESLARSKPFYDRLIKTINDWLTENSFRKLPASSHYHDVETDLTALKSDLTAWVNGLFCSVDKTIELDSYIDRLHAINSKISSARSELYHDISKEEKDKRQRDCELYRLREIENTNFDFISKIDELNVNLSNNPTLIIHGEAGCGKSHLLGDIAMRRKDFSLPTVLVLGNNFTNGTIERNILNQLGLSCTFDDFAKNLNEIGLRMRSRALIMIDAINEGPGPDLWRNQIAGFIKTIENYPAIGLVLTIRDTYYQEIIPKDFESNKKITIVEHIGFNGNEYEALSLFCENYGLILPNFPILTPEYSNPLFLHLICTTIRESADKTFPSGFNGIRKTLKLYLDCQDNKFGQKRHEYKFISVVSMAIEVLSKGIFNAEYERLNIKEAYSLLNEQFPNLNNLLADLIEEGILIKHHYHFANESFEYVVFSYQRFGDFCIAEELLNPYNSYEELLDGFSHDSGLSKIKVDNWQYDGLFEALSVLVPEKYNHELYELSDFLIDKSIPHQSHEISETEHIYRFADLLVQSLKWRSIDNIDAEKITEWIDVNQCIDTDTWIYTITELSSVPNHPFNSDYLHHWLLNLSMPIRDSFLQRHLQYYNGYNDYNVAFPIRRLIDWAWSPDISKNTDAETARLTAQSLAWVLSSTNNTLRDQATKALVNLLEQKPVSLISVLRAFEQVDDPYIKERLFAVTYGCTLRTENEESVSLIANYVFETIFKNGQPPVHILLRDYARNVVEYAIYRNVIADIDVELIRPPYQSNKPVFPRNEEIQCYILDSNDPEYDKNHGAEHNAIYYSLIGGFADFGHYVVENAVGVFLSTPIKDCSRLYKSKDGKLNAMEAQNWILKRVFEMGYDEKIHGEFDSFVRRIKYYSENRIERIGKKYQWIAFHELMARIADNYCMIDKWSDICINYKGPWQLRLRNIDPVYIKRQIKHEFSGSTFDITKKKWWEDEKYSHWNVPDHEWVNTIDDLVSPQSIIMKQDEQGTEWLRLSHNVSWKEPQRIGDDQYQGKQIWYLIQAFLVDKIDKQSIVKYLSKQNLWGRWLPENNDNDVLFNREKYWSPACKDTDANEVMRSVIRNTDFKVIIPDEGAKGSIEDDKSGSNQNYSIPCRFVFEGLNLQYAPVDGDLVNLQGETIVVNKDGNGCLVKKKEMVEFLEKNNLEIIWTVLGEKFTIEKTMLGATYFKVPCGVYYLENGEVNGMLKMYDRH